MMGLDWLYSSLPNEIFYNITVSLSVLSCEETLPNSNEIPESNPKQDDTNSGINKDGLLDSFLNLFLAPEETIETEDFQSLPVFSTNHCDAIFNFYNDQSIPLIYLLYGSVSLFIMSTSFILFICCMCKNTSKASKVQAKLEHSKLESKTDEAKPTGSNISKEVDTEVKSEDVKLKKVNTPLIISVPRMSSQEVKNVQKYFSLDELFEGTVGSFLKELDRSLGIELCLSSSGYNASISLPASIDASSSMTSPRLIRRGLHRSRHSAQSLNLTESSHRQVDESVSRYWILYENLKKRLNWTFPDTNLDSDSFEQGDSKMTKILQFLHQNCYIGPRQWNAATSVVDYTLFILEQELRISAEAISDGIKFSRFESIGSAASGTLTSSADRLDVLFVLDLSNTTEISVLHSNFCEDIPAGHIVLGVKHDISKQNTKLLRKACIQGLFGFYLVPQQVEDFVESSLKKVIVKLNCDHKNKMDRLPFKFQMSPNKKLILTFDIRLIQALGLGLGEINVRFIPAIMLLVPQYSLLPPVYAVLPWHQESQISQMNNSESGSVFGRIFRDQGYANLFWSLSVEKIQASIIQNIDQRFNLSEVRSHHKECLMILKALFSQGSRNNLLNRGEIQACVLETIVSFLLLESSPSAWTLENLIDRVSDAVHFLKSAFENVWLPNFVVHNPHLTTQAPSLQILSPLLSGRQQNMLANISSDASLKVLDYIDQRLHETGLNKCIKPDYSSDMWEYEFFLFG